MKYHSEMMVHTRWFLHL